MGYLPGKYAFAKLWLITATESGNGNSRRRMPYARLKIAVVDSIPRAKVNTTVIVNPGLRRNYRTAKPMFCDSDIVSQYYSTGCLARGYLKK